ncbi:unnamed protein product [Cladocopium goreaui]|uniref:Uncharacterized protein n=1 Tax=Cladocopium goreaui TaxID=2562237 RepID=A0A9P1FNC1_9DINO|nr:unnamed protein product [Cladocopium goreaui]
MENMKRRSEALAFQNVIRLRDWRPQTQKRPQRVIVRRGAVINRNEALDPINCKTLSKVKNITPNTGLMGDRNDELPARPIASPCLTASVLAMFETRVKLLENKRGRGSVEGHEMPTPLEELLVEEEEVDPFSLLQLCISLAAGIVLQTGQKMAPANGAPFLEPAEAKFPEPREDMMAAEYLIHRVSHVAKPSLAPGSAHACDDGQQASKNRPCQLDGNDLPCWNSGAWLGGSQVVECEMSCLHQKRVMQPQYSCSDFTGVDSKTSCFGRGDSTGSKCMFVTYQDQHGAAKSSCAPCELQGVGNVDCPVAGGKGPELNSTVTMCSSQCEAPRPDAHVTLPPAVGNPGLSRVAAAPDAMLSAPVSPPLAPAESETALATRAQVASAMTTTTPYGKAPNYFPMVVYRSPQDVSAATLPAAAQALPWPVELPKLEETNN